MDFGGILENAVRSGLGPDAAVLALAAIGLNVQFGYTGLRNFGQVGFMLVGAYGLGITIDTLGWSMWIGIGVGLLAAVALALLLGLPTLRLRADYFAIVTIAAAEILRFVARSTSATDVTGGPFGLPKPRSGGKKNLASDFADLNPLANGRRYGWGQLSYSGRDLWTLLITWALVALFTLLVIGLMRSPWGRILKSIREDEDVVRSLGKNAFSYKMQSLVLGGVIAAFGGIMLTLGNSSVGANSYQPQVTFFAYAVLILGGAATPLGPIIGAFLFQFLFAGSQSLLAQLGDEGHLPQVLRGDEAQGALALALVGVGLMLLMAFRPQGIFGSREEMALG